MSEVSDADARAVLQEHGRPVGKRGRLSAAQRQEYNTIMAGPDISADHVTDIGDPPPPPAAGGGGGPRLDDERPPRRVDAGGGGPRVRGLWERRPRAAAPPPRSPKGGKGKQRPKRAEHPWRSTAGVIEHTWSRAAQAFGGLPPVQRVMAAQAPLAGVVFEGRLRETIIDRVLLQPAARWEATGEAVSAMLGVPLFTALITFRGKAQLVPDGQGGALLGENGQPVAMLKPDGSPMWDAQTELGMVAPLRYCLMSWLAVSERYADEVIAQAEATVRQAAEADRIIAWIFAAPGAAGSWQDMQAEARARAEDFARGPAPEQPRPGGSSAFRPALTASVLAGRVVE